MGGLKQEVVSTEELCSEELCSEELCSNSLCSEAGNGHVGVQNSYHLHDMILSHLEDKLLVIPGRDFEVIRTEEGGLTLPMGGGPSHGMRPRME